MDDREAIRRVRNRATCDSEAPAKILGDAGIDIESAELWQGESTWWMGWLNSWKR